MAHQRQKIKRIFKKKIAIVASRFNEFVTQRLLKACGEALGHQGIKKENLIVVWVPGSLEIPLAALTLARRKDVEAVICLGAVIRGETFHFELVARGVADGAARVSLLAEKPVIFGVLTTDTVDQAYQRSQDKGSNKGRDAASAALEMIDAMSKINMKSDK